jgi:hypothetical protein
MTGLRLALIALASYPAMAQPLTEAVPLPAELIPFVEPGSIPIALEQADLDRDGRMDWLLVLEYAKSRIDPSDRFEEEGPRALLLLRRGADGRPVMVARNDRVVYCRGCGGMMGDPFQGLEVAAGRFTVINAGGSRYRWSRAFTFAWSRIDSAWQLVRIEDGSLDIHDPRQREKRSVRRPPKDYGKIDFKAYKPDQ